MEFPVNRELKMTTITKHINYANVEVAMNPYKGWSNKPYIVIMADHPDFTHLTYVYVPQDGLYYLQTEEGYTDFFYHKDTIKKVDEKESDQREYQTEHNHGGYGDRTFDIRVVRPEHPTPVKLGVRGPWSGGCYVANNHLPKPAIEVTFTAPSTYMKSTPDHTFWSHTSGCLTVEKVNDLFKRDKSLWMCKLTDDSRIYPESCINPKGKVEHRPKVPEFCYAEGQSYFDGIQDKPELYLKKEEWKASTLNALESIWTTFHKRKKF